MVQTEDQYIFIHDALLEAVTCGNTEVPARNLYAYIQKLTQVEPGENVTGMELEFKVMETLFKIEFLSVDSELETAHQSKNVIDFFFQSTALYEPLWCSRRQLADQVTHMISEAIH